MAHATSSQTIGPFWHLLEEPSWSDLTRFGAEGERMALIGQVTDGDGVPVADGCVEIWQPSPPATDAFDGFGRCATDVEGNFRFTTLKPDAVPGLGNALQAPHIVVTLFARGLLKALVTRAYFAGDPRNEADPLLAAIDDPGRRQTLIARRVEIENAGIETWRLDIRLQGDDETVFLDI